MLTQICQYLRNWFVRTKMFGTFKIENGALTFADGMTLPLLPGQYYRIIGSVFNDGVHRLSGAEEPVEETVAPDVGDSEESADPPAPEPETDPYETLTDEPAFSGSVWTMAVPPEVVALDNEIENWIKANEAVLNSPYSSESFGGYSYTIRTNYSAQGGSAQLSWQSVFGYQLNPWRKI